jgi:pseudouridine-5'-phosphate glycosidase
MRTAVPLVLSEAVAAAVRDGAPVVALESTIISHGFPRPRNLEVAHALEAELRSAGVVPATIAVLDGAARVGLDEAQLARVAEQPDVVKVSTRDLALALTQGLTGATTVAATMHLAHRAGLRVFATGGLGGVHRGAGESFDESADLVALARVPVTVVAAGVKSILDVPATLERLETLGVAVVGYRTSRFPGFYLADSGHDLPWRVESPQQVADLIAAQDALGVHSGIVLANPVPVADQLDPALHERVLAEALAAATAQGLRGGAVTPFLLDHLQRATGGASLDVNVAVARSNAALAAQVALARAGAR